MDSTDSKLEYPNLRNTSVVDSVQNWITDQIIKGNLCPGDKLPTESELCQNLGAGRNSVREAIKKLEAYGVVYIKRAEGTFVCENYNQNMLDPMLYNIILRKNNWSDFVDMRRTIDIGTLYVVMRKIKDGSELEPVRRALKELETLALKKRGSVEAITDADCSFHNAVTAMSSNPQLITLTDYINRITVPSRVETARAVMEQGEMERYVELHRQWLSVMEQGAFDQIENVVVGHYVFWTKVNSD